jgi:hypothetical protein
MTDPWAGGELAARIRSAQTRLVEDGPTVDKPDEIRSRLEELRTEIVAERISFGEIAELQGLAEYIDPSDVRLLEWAGVPEFDDED